MNKSDSKEEDAMDKGLLDIKEIDSEAYPRKGLSETVQKRDFLSKETLAKPRQLFREIAGKVSRIGKDSCIAALSSIGASKRAGKTAVLRMEIASRKRKMKEVFSKLGERVYDVDEAKVANIFEDVSIRALINTLKSCDHEIKEIEQYSTSLEKSGDVKKYIDSNINEPGDIRAGSEGMTTITGASGETERTSTPLSTYVEAIKDENTEVRIKALKQFFKFDGSEAIPHLVNALRDKNAEVRRKAALYLGWKVAVSAAPPLIVVAKDKDPSVRKTSLEALGELGAKEAVPVLIEGLDDRDREVRKAAYKSLTKVTNEFIEFNTDGPLSERFKSIQKWEKWWGEEKK